MKVIPKEIINSNHPGESNNVALTSGKLYFVIGVSDDYFRIINDNGEPILYEKTIFIIVDPEIPKDWIVQECFDGEEKYYYINPLGFDKPGFYEDYFDGIEYAVKMFKEYITGNTFLTNIKPLDEE